MTQSKKIENPKTPLSTKTTFNDFDILSSALSTEKSLTNTYATSMLEASNEKVSTLLFDLLKDSSQQYRKLFVLQFLHGWYSLTPADTQEINALHQQYSDYKQQLNK